VVEGKKVTRKGVGKTSAHSLNSSAPTSKERKEKEKHSSRKNGEKKEEKFDKLRKNNGGKRTTSLCVRGGRTNGAAE